MTESTRTALLDAAEAAFASDGVDHASLRSVMREAGVNPAAVHYHFGSRDALAQAVLDRVLEPLQMRRLALLDKLVAAGKQDDPAVSSRHWYVRTSSRRSPCPTAMTGATGSSAPSTRSHRPS